MAVYLAVELCQLSHVSHVKTPIGNNGLSKSAALGRNYWQTLLRAFPSAEVSY